jgi:2-(3-amino-3-carboxypropyl)histidine synthase
MYDFEIDRIVRIIKDENYKMVGLQFPEGLKDHAASVADEISSKAGCKVIISSDPCYGACDLADEEMKALGCEALFHFGHSEMLEKLVIPVFYIEVRLEADPLPLIEKNLDRLSKRVGLITTVQHIQTLDRARDFLERKGFEVHVGEAKGRARYAGQVLGCSFGSATGIAKKVDCFLYIGSGNFHPLGVSLATGKPTLAFDPLVGEVRDMQEFKDKILRQRFAQIAKAKEAETFGIIIGEKKGQMRRGLALKIKEKLEKLGKKAYLISLREVSPENLLSFRKLDAFVSTACPRIAIDDAARYKQPLLTPVELEILLGEREWEDYGMDEISY